MGVAGMVRRLGAASGRVAVVVCIGNLCAGVMSGTHPEHTLRDRLVSVRCTHVVATSTVVHACVHTFSTMIARSVQTMIMHMSVLTYPIAIASTPRP